MNPWLAPYFWFSKGPLSGDVTQDISPYTSFLSPQIELNFAGDRNIEQKVVSEVASYGKQLGIITEALLAVSREQSSPEIERLKELNDQITELKEQNANELVNSVTNDLERLKQSDPEALQNILETYSASKK